ncbi:ANKRD50, partial [Symbiodinium necroappetens]
QLLLKSRADKELTDNEGNTANPDARNQSGKTALMYSAIHGSDDNVTLLLTWGADRNLCDSNGRGALDSAKSNGHWKIAQTLQNWTNREAATPRMSFLQTSMESFRTLRSLVQSLRIDACGRGS